MASSAQKKTTTTRKSTASKSTTRGKKRTPPPPPKQPVRREVWGIVLLVLALCVFVSYCGISAIFIDWFAALLKGLFGYGYWLACPALVLSALILLFHKGRPVVLRVTCALLTPLLLGSILHMILCKVEFESSLGILKNLWATGQSLTSGGAVSGSLAVGFVAVFSQYASLPIFILLLVIALMIALRLTPAVLWEKLRERPQYEPEPEEEPVKTPPVRAAAPEPVRMSAPERSRPQIDFPLDDVPARAEKAPAEPEEKEGRFTGFFRHKSDRQKTPDQVLSGEESAKTEEAASSQPVRTCHSGDGPPDRNEACSGTHDGRTCCGTCGPHCLRRLRQKGCGGRAGGGHRSGQRGDRREALRRGGDVPLSAHYPAP